jgi:hypothetical protein
MWCGSVDWGCGGSVVKGACGGSVGKGACGGSVGKGACGGSVGKGACGVAQLIGVVVAQLVRVRVGGGGGFRSNLRM